MLVKENLCDMWCYIWVWFCLHIYYWHFPKDFETVRVITCVCDSYIRVTELFVFIFEFIHVLYRWILTIQDVWKLSWLFSIIKSCMTIINKSFEHFQCYVEDESLCYSLCAQFFQGIIQIITIIDKPIGPKFSGSWWMSARFSDGTDGCRFTTL